MQAASGFDARIVAMQPCPSLRSGTAIHLGEDQMCGGRLLVFDVTDEPEADGDAAELEGEAPPRRLKL
eukprot:3605456-Pleurochrysis_carterae.AAC.1